MSIFALSAFYPALLMSAASLDTAFCSTDFWQNSRVMGFNIGGSSLAGLVIEIVPEAGDDDIIFSGAQWNGSQRDFWNYPISLSVDVNWDDDRLPPSGTTFVLKVDGQEKARKVGHDIDPKTAGFQWDLTKKPPNLFGHTYVEIVWLAPDGKTLRREKSRLPDWTYLRGRAEIARRRLTKDFGRDKRLCGPGISI